MKKTISKETKNNPKKSLKLAIFDIDGTIFRSSLLIELVDALVKEGIFPEKALKEIQRDYTAWLNRIGTYPTYIQKVINTYFKYLKGAQVKDVERVGKQMLNSKKHRVYVYTRDLIKDLRKKKYFILAISASPDFLVSYFAKELGFDLAFGSQYGAVNGKYTGELLNGHHIYKKNDFLMHALIQIAQRTKKFIDLKDSIGVGDTESDIPFLETVGKAIAFNPNRNLAEHAKNRKWHIVVERKDVIYKLTDFEFNG